MIVFMSFNWLKDIQTATTFEESEIDRELWLQNVAGYIIFKDVREYAIEKIPLEIDDAIYGMMMMME